MEAFSAHFVQLKRRRGALRIPEEEKAAVKVARDVAQAEEQLREVYQCAKEKFAEPKRKTGGYWSSPELVEEEMIDEGFDADHVSVVVRRKTLTGAAQQYVAAQTGRTPESVKAMASTGRKWLRKHPPEAREG